MATATIVSVWTTSSTAYMAVSVIEAGGRLTEYIGSVDRSTLVGLLPAQKRAALRDAVKAVRDAQLDAITPDVTISGTVQV
jgi:hypothetical protein